MTHDETRDELARMDGWTIEQTTRRDGVIWVKKDATGLSWMPDHPYPPTLDGADAAVPEGWKWYRHTTVGGVIWAAVDACAWLYVSVPDTGDKIADLYALAMACRKAMENKA